ncbi:unnamed protein product [Amoebophrya sp. A25]|nr:unnamed protein product [Amoebophrya sp. A25]|eukprot:GSA25T00015407001.1
MPVPSRKPETAFGGPEGKRLRPVQTEEEGMAVAFEILAIASPSRAETANQRTATRSLDSLHGGAAAAFQDQGRDANHDAVKDVLDFQHSTTATGASREDHTSTPAQGQAVFEGFYSSTSTAANINTPFPLVVPIPIAAEQEPLPDDLEGLLDDLPEGEEVEALIREPHHTSTACASSDKMVSSKAKDLRSTATGDGNHDLAVDARSAKKRKRSTSAERKRRQQFLRREALDETRIPLAEGDELTVFGESDLSYQNLDGVVGADSDGTASGAAAVKTTTDKEKVVEASVRESSKDSEKENEMQRPSEDASAATASSSIKDTPTVLAASCSSSSASGVSGHNDVAATKNDISSTDSTTSTGSNSSSTSPKQSDEDTATTEEGTSTSSKKKEAQSSPQAKVSSTSSASSSSSSTGEQKKQEQEDDDGVAEEKKVEKESSSLREENAETGDAAKPSTTITFKKVEELLSKEGNAFRAPKEVYERGKKCRDFVDSMLKRCLAVVGRPYQMQVHSVALGPERDIIRLLKYAHHIVSDQPMFLELEAPINVIGDIHGQYGDLLQHFEQNGFPPKSNYLLLGDYVDRGQQSLETMCLLLCYKIKYPENFFILRGNHECTHISRLYGFHDECKRKYSVKLWKEFTQFFNWLPIAATVGGRIFCAHGGLSTEFFTQRDDVCVNNPDSEAEDSEEDDEELLELSRKNDELVCESATAAEMSAMLRSARAEDDEPVFLPVWPTSPISSDSGSSASAGSNASNNSAASNSVSSNGTGPGDSPSAASPSGKEGEPKEGGRASSSSRKSSKKRTKKKRSPKQQLVDHINELLASTEGEEGKKDTTAGSSAEDKSSGSSSSSASVSKDEDAPIASDDEAKDLPLPEGWIAMASEVLPGHTFYRNEKTGQVSVKHPALPKKDEGSSSSSASSSDSTKDSEAAPQDATTSSAAAATTAAPARGAEASSSSSAASPISSAVAVPVSPAPSSSSSTVADSYSGCLVNRGENLSEQRIANAIKSRLRKKEITIEEARALVERLRDERGLVLETGLEQILDDPTSPSTSSTSGKKKNLSATFSPNTSIDLDKTSPSSSSSSSKQASLEQYVPSPRNALSKVMRTKLPNRPCEIPEYGLMCDVLWSDPSPAVPYWGSNERGVSFCFGASVVDSFCKKFGIDLVCRAHQCVESGYWFFARKKLVTIFSAPDYCGEMDNNGAVLRVDKSLSCKFEVITSSQRRKLIRDGLQMNRRANLDKLVKTGELEWIHNEEKQAGNRKKRRT